LFFRLVQYWLYRDSPYQNYGDKMPTMLIKYPGPHQFQDGKYDYCILPDEDVDEALTEGWARTPPEARAIHEASKVVPADNAPPTRAELEAKARQLGIKFDGRTGDVNLAKAIKDALEK
jgi:hypothetical protein